MVRDSHRGIRRRARNLVPSLLGALALVPPSLAAQVPGIRDIRPPSCFSPGPIRGLDIRDHVYGVLEHHGWLYAPVTAGRDTTHLLRLPSRATANSDVLPTVTVLEELAGAHLRTIRAADIEGDSLILWTEDHRFAVAGGAWTVGPNPEPSLYAHNPSSRRAGSVGIPSVRLWVPFAWAWGWMAEPTPGRRLLIWGSALGVNGRGPAGAGIHELGSPGATQGSSRQGAGRDSVGAFHPLPLPSRRDFSRLVTGVRLDSLEARGRYLDALEAEIGAFDVRDGQLWFGVSFYDGEGISGVGGWGRFDPRENRYEMHWGSPVADASVTAMVHDGEALWFGLARRREWTIQGAGLAVLTLSDGTTRRFDVPGVVDVLCPVDGVLWVGTREGLFRLHDGTVEPIWRGGGPDDS